jgi:hypothetical protein
MPPLDRPLSTGGPGRATMRPMRSAFEAAWSIARRVLLVAGLVAVVFGLLALAIWVVPDALVGAQQSRKPGC